MSRHCTSGRPASIMTENWRTKIARFLAGTLAPPFFPAFGLASAFALTASILVIWICWRRSACTAPSIVSAMCSPVTVCPARVRPA
jgi:hypothetical protein